MKTEKKNLEKFKQAKKIEKVKGGSPVFHRDPGGTYISGECSGLPRNC